MDPTRFDALARALTTPRSRRGAARLLGSLALASSALRDDGAAIAKRHKRKRCPQKAAPHWCASAKVCTPACPFGAKFDPLTCQCVCPQRTCCLSTGGSNPFCSSAYPNEELCGEAILTRNPDGIGGGFCQVVGGGTCSCGGDRCQRTCAAGDCQGADTCAGAPGACPITGTCFQPLGGGPTRCGVANHNTCGCMSHQDCVTLFGLGLGAFCATFAPGGAFCSCNGASSFCVMPPPLS